MKIKYSILILLSLFIYNLYANEDGYNFYERDIFFGQYILTYKENINSEINYKIEYSDERVVITGYYFNSNKIKFIDTYLNNKLVNTEYFSKLEKKIFERTYKYDNEGRIILVETNVRNENSKLKYLSKNYFEYSNKKINVNCFTNYSLTKNTKLENYYCMGNLILNNLYKPLVAHSKILISSDEKGDFLDISEKWNYKKAGYDYQCDVNSQKKCFYSFNLNKGITKNKEFFEDKKMFYKEYYEILENNIFITKYYDNNIQENIGICNYYSDTYKEFLYKDIKHIYLQDEKIILKDDIIRTDNLSIPLDIFGFRYIGMDYTLYE